jgi:ectoine hydroxylase-related dioxygenase (phytanoyl-CoA dioxygenase family)
MQIDMTTVQQRQQYRDDGVTVVRGAFDDVWVERIREVTARSMAEQTGLTREYETNAGGRFHAATFLWLHDADVAAFVRESPAARIAAELMGSETVSFFFDHLLVKEPGTENPTPWHQDLPYWPVAGSQICSLWFALDPVDESSGGVRYVAGSHRTQQWYRAQSFGGTDKYTDPDLPPPPDPDADGANCTIVSFDLEPGDVVVHHVMTLHGAPGNGRSDRRRRGLATRWCGDDAVFDPRARTMELPFDPDVQPGDPMRSNRFPVILDRRQQGHAAASAGAATSLP